MQADRKRPLPTVLRNGAAAFTLVEMLVVITIIMILAGLLLPSLNRAIESAQTSTCANNLKQVSLMTATYSDSNNGMLPRYDWNGSYCSWLMEYGGYPVNQWHNYSPDAGKMGSLFACPAAPLGLLSGSYPGVRVGLNYMPTLTAWGSTAPMLQNPQYGGAQHYYGSPYGKRVSRVTDNSVLMFEGWVVDCFSFNHLGVIYSYLKPASNSGFYTGSSYSHISAYPNRSGATFTHNESSNFLYKDGSVRSHRLGTVWNLNWQTQN